MAKIKPIRGKKKKKKANLEALPCLLLLALGMILISLLLYVLLKSAS